MYDICPGHLVPLLLKAASKTPRSRKVANQWINVIRADLERNEQIRLAEEAARKKRQEIQERLEQSGRA